MIPINSSIRGIQPGNELIDNWEDELERFLFLKKFKRDDDLQMRMWLLNDHFVDVHSSLK